MAGYWSQSRSQIHDLNGKPLVNAQARFTLGGTTTPITVYQDSGLAVALSNPVVSDGYGFFPAVFFDEADNFFNVTVYTATGTLLYSDITIPIIGPTAGGGGSEVPVDPDALLKTGDMLIRYGFEFRSGMVRLNGRSIGSATSGASERANSDTQALYYYLWNTDANIVITGGRGANAAADFSANKPLELPDWRGRTFVGLDTMGNTAAGIISAATPLGWTGGEAAHTLSIDEIATHAHPLFDPGHAHTLGGQRQALINAPGTGIGVLYGAAGSPLLSDSNTTGITLGTTGGGLSHNNIQPSKACSVYMKL